MVGGGDGRTDGQAATAVGLPSLRPLSLSLCLPPSRFLALFRCSQGKTLKSQQWSQREMGKEREGGDGTAQRFQQLNQHLGFLAVKRKEVGKTLNLMLLMLFIIGDCTKGADFS